MRQTQALPTLIALIALAVATASLLGGRATPATASILVAQIEPAGVLGGFTYQGSLTRAGQLVDGANACDMRFSLWDAASGGAQLGAAQTVDGVDFVQGLFTVTLNDAGQFGAAAFAGEARWLYVEAACPGGSAFTSLGRQAISAAPYATYSGSTAALQGRPVSAGAPGTGEVLGWDGSAWGPTALESGAELQGRPVSMSAPETGQVLRWDGSAWAPAAASISGYEIVYVETAFDSRAVKAVRASCPGGKQVLGGGAGVFSVLSDPNFESSPVVLKQSEPDRPPFPGWFARAVEVGPYGYEWIVWAYAICATIS